MNVEKGKGVLVARFGWRRPLLMGSFGLRALRRRRPLRFGHRPFDIFKHAGADQSQTNSRRFAYELAGTHLHHQFAVVPNIVMRLRHFRILELSGSG